MDCSGKMLAVAARKGIYDRLFKQDILEAWQTRTVFDLIYSSDCMVYFGNLEPVFLQVASNMAPGGIFAFSVERPDGTAGARDFQLKTSGRFGHSESFIGKCLENAGFTLLGKKACRLRKEADQPVEGLLLVAGLQPCPQA